ncbi:MAG: hypothetical protein Q9207_000954 [Kuettlingeria erythrocarpa]
MESGHESSDTTNLIQTDFLRHLGYEFNNVHALELYKIIRRAHNHTKVHQSLQTQPQTRIAEIKGVDSAHQQMRNQLQKLAHKLSADIATLYDLFARAQRMRGLLLKATLNKIPVFIAFSMGSPTRIGIDMLFQSPGKRGVVEWRQEDYKRYEAQLRTEIHPDFLGEN